MNTRQSIVVTGSTRGIGKGMAADILKRGHNVTISGRTQAAVDLTLIELQSLATDGARAIGIACDVTQGNQLHTLWEASVQAFGHIDIWVNNAGVSHPRQRAGVMHEKDMRSVPEINLLGMMLATQIAALGMQAQATGGTIYNMEGYGSNGMMNPGMSLYGASKFGLTYFNKALLTELKDSKVRLCYLSPGIVLTDLLLHDIASTSPAEQERTQRIYNILADTVETVTPWLVDNILMPQKSGARIAWLTDAKAGQRFIMSLFKKRKLFNAP